MNLYGSEWIHKDMAANFLGIFSLAITFDDRQKAIPDERDRKKTSSKKFIEAVETYYKPTENLNLKNQHFCSVTQENNESFASFCNRVKKKPNIVIFKSTHKESASEIIAVRDQVIRNINKNIKKKKRSFEELLIFTEKLIESSMHGILELSGEAPIKKIGNLERKTYQKDLI